MNFMERRALKRAEAALRPMMKSGETAEEFDIGKLPDGRTSVHCIATQQALYCAPHGRAEQAFRLPYEVIRSVFWSPQFYGGAFTLRLTDGQQVALDMGRAPRERFGEFVKERVGALVRHHVHVPLAPDGKGADLRWRPMSEGGQSVWDVSFDDGIDPDDPSVDQEVRQRIAELGQTLGLND